MNMAQIKQSRPDSGLGFEDNFFTTFRVALSLLGSVCVYQELDSRYSSALSAGPKTNKGASGGRGNEYN